MVKNVLYGAPIGLTIDYSLAPHEALVAPTSGNYRFDIGQLWINTVTGSVYVLTSKASNSAVWVLLGGQSSFLATLTGDSGGAITPSTGNINTLGTANQITTTGSGHTITWSLPSALIAPGSIVSTTTIASGTTLAAGTSFAAGTSVTAGTSLTATLGNITATNGNLVLTAAGNKMVRTSVASNTTAGANSIGTVTLVGGTATVSTTAVTASSIIQLFRQGVGATGAAALGILSVGTITASTSFVINAVQAANATALQASDVSVIGWEIIN